MFAFIIFSGQMTMEKDLLEILGHVRVESHFHLGKSVNASVRLRQGFTHIILSLGFDHPR